MDYLSDTELAALAAGGDPLAFERLIKRHYMLVYKVSYKWCGIKEEAEDIAQEVFVKVAGKIKGFRQDSAFKTWLYRITMNTAKDFSRKNITRKDHESAFVEEQKLAQHEPAGGNPVSPARLCAAIRKLPVKLREAVILVFSEGLSHREAARALNCAETTVSWRIFQAKKKLKEYLVQGV